MQQQQASSSSAGTAFVRAQSLVDDYSVYELGRQPPSQHKRQLDVLPISAYGGWDSGLPPVSGRLIAVNHSYVCYCLRSSASIRILGRNGPSRGLFQRHTQRVTDIEFFAVDLNLVASVSLDGRLFVWKVVEIACGKDNFQLQQHVILAIQFDGSWKDVCFRVCWHPHSQEILMVCMSNHIFKIDVEKARSKASELKASLSCLAANLIDGISCIGQHDVEVTDFSIFVQDVLYIASACNDGMVRIWEDRKVTLLAVLVPHNEQPVGRVFIITCDKQPTRVALLTSDSANKELKLWVPPAASCKFSTWHLVQTLEFKNCGRISTEKLFLNSICTLPQAGLVFLGNPKLPSLYSLHLKFDGALNDVRMDNLAEFSLSMPILSFTAVIETGSSCKDMAQIFCVQTQAIQEYFLNISDCLLSQCDDPSSVSSSRALLEGEFMKISVCETVEGEHESKRSDLTSKEMIGLATGNSNSGSGFGSWVEVPNWIAATLKRKPNIASPLASGHGAESRESRREEEPHMILRGSRAISDPEITADWSEVISCSGAKLDHFKSEIQIANARVEMEEMKGGLFYNENQEESDPRDLGKHFSKVRKKRTRMMRKNLEFRVTNRLYTDPQEELSPPELKSPAINLQRKRTSRRKGLWFRLAKGKLKEKAELTLPNLGSPSNNSKRRITRKRRKRGTEVNRGSICLFSRKSASQVLQNDVPSPSVNGEGLFEQLVAIRESVDQLLTTQMEVQNYLSTVIDVSLSRESELMDTFQENWTHKYLSPYWDTIWRHVAKKPNQNTLQLEWTVQLRKAFDEFLSTDFLTTPSCMLTLEALSCIQTNISMLISASLSKSLISNLPQILEGWDEDISRYVESSFDTTLSTTLTEQMVLTWWKHLIQVERIYFLRKWY